MLATVGFRLATEMAVRPLYTERDLERTFHAGLSVCRDTPRNTFQRRCNIWIDSSISKQNFQCQLDLSAIDASAANNAKLRRAGAKIGIGKRSVVESVEEFGPEL